MIGFRQFLIESSTVHEMSGMDFFWKYYNNGVGSNPDIFDRIKYLLSRGLQKEDVLFCLDGKKVIGVLGIQKSPYEKNTMWLKYVSVDEQYRNQGIAKSLLEKLYQKATKEGFTIKRSTPTEMGKKYLTNIHKKLQDKYKKVKVIT